MTPEIQLKFVSEISAVGAAPLISVQASTGGLWSAAGVQVMKQCSVFYLMTWSISVHAFSRRQLMMCGGFEELSPLIREI